MGRLSFSEAFNPYIQNTANLLSRHFMQSGEDERAKAEQLKYQQEQAGILNQLVAGGKRGKIDSLSMGTIPFSPQEQTGLISQADDNTLQRYKLISEMNKPKTQKVDYEEWDGNKYLKNPDGSVDFTKPVTQKEEKPDFVETDYVGNKQIRREFFKQEDGTVKSVDIPTGFLKDTRTSKQDANGNLYETLHKDYQKELKQRADRFLTARDMKFAADQTKDGIPYSDPLTGMKYTITSKTANGMVESGKNQLQNYLDNNGGEQNKSYFKNVQLESWDAVQKEGEGDHGVTTWKYIEEDYINGTITDADFLEARYRFIAKWGYDPTTRMR